MLIHPFNVNKDSAVLALLSIHSGNEFYDEHARPTPFLSIVIVCLLF